MREIETEMTQTQRDHFMNHKVDDKCKGSLVQGHVGHENKVGDDGL